MTATNLFAPIVKTEKQPDGSMLVYGKVTGPDLDLDQQICDPQWLAQAMPDWFEIGNIREMHQAKAVGKALDLEQDGDDWLATVKVVDPGAVRLVDEGIYTGFSIGIKSPRVVKDAAAPGGRIVGGRIIETSLVDRPCNESAKLVLAKMAGADLVQVEEVVVKADGEDSSDEIDEVDLVQVARDALNALLVGEVAEVADGTGGRTVVSLLLDMLDDLDCFVMCDEWDDSQAAMAAMKTLLAEGPAKEDPVNLSDLVKAAAADDDQSAVVELRKALGVDDLRTLVEETHSKAADAETKATAAEQTADGLAARVAKVEEMAAPGGPSRFAPTASAGGDAHLVKAAEYDRKAAEVVDPAMAASYRQLAAQQRTLAATRSNG